MCGDGVTSGLDGRHIYFRFNATSHDIIDNTIEQLNLENMDIVVEILSVDVLELEITLEVFYPPLPVSIMCV